MNWKNLFEWVLMSAHTAAGCIYLVIGVLSTWLELLGPAVWAIPAGCLALLALDLTGRLSLRGVFPKAVAAFALPALLGWVDTLFWGEIAKWGDGWRFPEEQVCAAALLVLAAYALVREERGKSGPEKAADLLEQGNYLGVAGGLWLLSLAGVVVFMGTAGLLITMIIGALLAQQYTLLDHGGVKGILAGLLVLYLLQCLWYWRGTRLARREDPALDDGFPLIALLVPVWNMLRVRKLARALQMRGVKDFYRKAGWPI